MITTALLTCFNRRDQTLACLEALRALGLPESARLEIVLVDDGSTDGTGEAVRRRFPEVEVLLGDGALYWCGGMRMAWAHAALRDPDYYWLVNDDTRVGAEALMDLVAVAPSPDSRVIAVGAVRDPASGLAAYGGRTGRGGTELIPPTGRVEPCVTFNGNCVLVTRAVYRELGILHSAYTHGMGDFDYGFQATRRGIAILQTPGFVGECVLNPGSDSWRDRSASRLERLRRLHGPKAHPFREMVIYHRRNSGWLWPWRCLTPYLRILLGR